MRRTIRHSLIGLSVAAALVIANRSALTQTPERDRILEAIDNSSTVPLQGNVRPMFLPENDLGPVEGSLQLDNISLIFKLTETQQAELHTLLAEQQDPSSPNYHQWLTPALYAERFGLTRNDYDKVVTWVRSRGFEVTRTARSRTWVAFSGTAAQVQAAFQTEIHNYSLHGQTYYANATEPSVPSALAGVVLAIHALDNYPLKPLNIVRRVNPEPRPNFTSAVTGDTFVAPGDYAIIYDVKNLYAAGIDGSKESIAIIGQTDLYGDGSDITAFRSAAGLSANSPTVVLIPGVSDPGVVSADIEEASLDVEWSGAVATNATIIFVNGGANGVFNAAEYAVDNDTAPVISSSYGLCEADWGASNLNALTQLAQQANSQGQTIVAAAGDSGAAACDVPSSPTSIVTIATHGLAVNAPASLPYVTGMGGSEFNEGTGNYWLPASNGVDVPVSALSYIPEVVWNDTSSTNGLAAGGGGASSFFTKPSWQKGTGVPNDNARDVPDLAMNASPEHDSYLFCCQGSCVNGFRNSDGSLLVAGGTSAPAPAFAGIVALINQQMNTKGQGNINSVLYSMAATSPAAFHDITSGNNEVPCQAGTTDCPNGGEIGYSAGVGYDQASGLGSVDAFNLVTAWDSSGTGNLPAPTLTAPANGAIGVALSPAFGWTGVAGNNGYRIMIATTPADLPTNPATTSCGACTLVGTTSQNSNSYTPASALPVGLYYWQVQAIEPAASSGDAAWSNVFSFTTTGGTLAAPSLSAPANGAASVSLPPTFTWTAVKGNAGYRILIAENQSALPTNPAVSTCSSCKVGATTTSATYTPAASALQGGTTYYWEVQALAPSGSGENATWSSIFSFTGSPASFTLNASPDSVTIAAGGSGASTISLIPTNGFSATPTFTCTPPNSLVGVTCSLGAYDTSTDSVALTVTASSTASAFPRHQKHGPFGEWPGAILAAACVLLIALALWAGRDSRSLRWSACARQAALVALLGCIWVLALSCGGGGSGGGGSSPPPESGNITVQGVSGNLTATTTVYVTVN